MEAIIIQTDDYKTMAKTIFNHFIVGQSTKVIGTLIEDTPAGKRLKEKGEAVIEYLDWLDKQENFNKDGKRKRTRIPDSIGGFVAHKIFRYKRVISNDEVKYTIWRMQ